MKTKKKKPTKRKEESKKEPRKWPIPGAVTSLGGSSCDSTPMRSDGDDGVPERMMYN